MQQVIDEPAVASDAAAAHQPPLAAAHSMVYFETSPKEDEEKPSGILNRSSVNRQKRVQYWSLVTLSSIILVVSFISSSLLGRFYFVSGGANIWLYTLTQSAGFPIPACVLVITRLRRKQSFSNISPRAALAFAGLGALCAVDNIFYSWSVLYLPISTVGLLASTHLTSNALFAFVLAKTRLTPYSINTLVVVTLGATLLGLNSNTDRPTGTSKRKYIVGFMMALSSNILYGLLLPLMQMLLAFLVREEEEKFSKFTRETDDEHIRSRRSRKPRFVLLMEMHTIITGFATAFVLIGFVGFGHLKHLHGEMLSFSGGLWSYWMTLIWATVGWQLSLLATLAVIILTSSLYAGVLNTANLPFLSLCSVFFFHDHFGGLKGVAMALSLWGFASYLYGGYVNSL